MSADHIRCGLQVPAVWLLSVEHRNTRHYPAALTSYHIMQTVTDHRHFGWGQSNSLGKGLSLYLPLMGFCTVAAVSKPR